DAGELIKITGIEVPVSKFKAKKGGKPTRHTFYGYHFKPTGDAPVPYLIFVQNSTTSLISQKRREWKQANDAVKRGYGVILVDINRGVKSKKANEYGLRDAPPRTFGALSFIEYTVNNFSRYSNGKFGVWGTAFGGSAGIEINNRDHREGSFIFQNVSYWFDAAVAYYPLCSRVNLASPTLILIGEDDPVYPPANCRSWESSDQADNLTVKYLENATHFFDVAAYKNPKKVAGQIAKYDPQATEIANEAMFAFFDQNLKFPGISFIQAQTMLNKLGFNTGKPDGVFGRGSSAALKKFQSINGLRDWGLLDEKSQLLLQQMAN
ncbi:MAG: peptidoglycan-binding protein, partial [Rhizobiaceae bacterium]|nr:peptidoglycan-binding protein [Rhizobiaceae bacterium]